MKVLFVFVNNFAGNILVSLTTQLGCCSLFWHYRGKCFMACIMHEFRVRLVYIQGLSRRFDAIKA